MNQLFIRLNTLGDKGRLCELENDGTGKFTVVDTSTNYYDIEGALVDVIRGYKDAIADANESAEFKEGEELAQN